MSVHSKRVLLRKVAASGDPVQYVLPRDFFARSTTEVAMALLGKRLVSMVDDQLTAGWIVETEAYLPENDSACHATRGQTPGNRSMFAAGGMAYVYPIHSRHCFNVVTQSAEAGTAVLIRAVQPVSGIATMMQRRANAKPLDLCRGPGRLCEALGIDRALDEIPQGVFPKSASRLGPSEAATANGFELR